MPRVIRAIIVAVLCFTATPVAHATERTVISEGHVDLGPRIVDGRWTVQLRDDTGGQPVWRDLSDVVLHVADGAATTVPDDPAYAFLGTAGTPIWVLPQVQGDGVVWPGWNTQDPSIAEVSGREVDWRLHGVSGPGRFELFLSGNFGTPEPIFAADRPFPQETGIEKGTHVHGNWVFTAPGSYQLDMEMSTQDGKSDRRALRIHVGPGDPTDAFTDPAPRSAAPDPTAAPDTPDRTWIVAGAGVLLVIALLLVPALRRRKAAGKSDD